MPESKCSDCGEPLLGISRRTRCFKCQEKYDLLQRLLARQKKNEDITRMAREDGLILVHSCIANILDPPPPSCRCQRWVTSIQAQKFVSQGRCVDWETRQSFFVNRPIAETSKHKQTPRGAGIEKAHILRGVESITVKNSAAFKPPEQIKAEYDGLRKRIQEDRLERGEDERQRWTVWSELQRDFLRSITREVPESEWLDLELKNLDVPLFAFGIDQRTHGGIGVNVESTQEIFANDYTDHRQPSPGFGPTIQSEEKDDEVDENENCESDTGEYQEEAVYMGCKK
jgi:hypothetical protein